MSCLEEIAPLVSNMPENGKKLAKAYWPGPMTMVFPKSAIVPYGTTGGLDTVAIRMPSDPIAAELIRLSGVPIAAPSANTSGRLSPTRADHVLRDMDGKIDAIIDGGPVGIGLESTIVDVTEKMPMVLRPGAITVEMLRETVGEVGIDPAILGPVSADVRPKAPGMKYRHYAPKADLTLVEGETETVVETINRPAGEKLAEGRKGWNYLHGRDERPLPGGDAGKHRCAGASGRLLHTTCMQFCAISTIAARNISFRKDFRKTI